MLTLCKELWGATFPTNDLNILQDPYSFIPLYEKLKSENKDIVFKHDYYTIQIDGNECKISNKDMYKYQALSMLNYLIPQSLVLAISLMLIYKFCGYSLTDQLSEFDGQLKKDLSYLSKDLGKVKC